MKDLRDWLQAVDEAGELHRISEEVDWEEELGATTYMVGSRMNSPALLFEKIKGAQSGFRVVSNMLAASKDRIAITLRMPTGLHLLDMISRARELYKLRLPPLEVDKAGAPIMTHALRGDDVDVTIFPAPKLWPLDGGRYLGTGNITITRDPETGRINVGTYRQMVQGKRQLGLYISPGKDALLHRDRYWEKGEPMPVAVVHGMDPLLLVVGSMGFPKNVPEYDCAGGLMGRPVEVIQGELTGLPIPAHAEIAMEGFIHPEKYMPEGPFGEFQGYYGRPGGPTPFIEIERIYYRDDPIVCCALMSDYPACEQSLYFAVARSAKVWDDLDAMGVPGIRGVYMAPAGAGGFGMCIVSVEQRYAGHVAQTLALTAQCPGGAYYTKWIIAVDHDVDPTDMNQVIWAMTTRCNPEQDIDILRQTWSTYLDPTQNPPERRPYGSKALVNACMEHRYLKQFSKRSRLREEMYAQVSEKWSRFGLPDKPPIISTFEDFSEQGSIDEAD